MSGCLITFEGGEGVGKSTQIKYLEQKLRDDGHDVIVTREPGGTPAAEKIRNLLSDSEHGGKWSDHAELLLMFVARAEHVKDVIIPALTAGKVILCDRYIDSTRVYQGHIGTIPFEFIDYLEQQIVGDAAHPHLTFLLDVPANDAMKRVHDRGAVDHYDQGDLAFYQKLRDGFLKIAAQENRIKIIDGLQAEQDIAAHIYDHAKEHLHEHV